MYYIIYMVQYIVQHSIVITLILLVQYIVQQSIVYYIKKYDTSLVVCILYGINNTVLYIYSLYSISII